MSASARTRVPGVEREARPAARWSCPPGRSSRDAVAVDLDLAEHGDRQHSPESRPCSLPSARRQRTTVSPPSALSPSSRDRRPDALLRRLVGGDARAAAEVLAAGPDQRLASRSWSPPPCSPATTTYLDRAATAAVEPAANASWSSSPTPTCAATPTCSTCSSATTSPTTPTTCSRPGSPADPSRTRTPEHHETRSTPMSHAHTVRPAARHRSPGARSPAGWSRSSGFPLGGLAAMILTGPGRQRRPRALAGGLVTGSRARGRPGLGAAPRPPRRMVAWTARHGSRPRRRARRRRRRSSTSAPAWATWSSRAPSPAPPSVLAQARVLLRRRLGRLRLAGRLPRRGLGRSAGRSPPRSASQVEEQFTVFGSSGAVTVALLTAVLPRRPRPHREERGHEPPRRLRDRPGRPPPRRAARALAATTSSPSTATDAGTFPGAEVVGGDATDPALHHRGVRRAPTSSTSASTR